VQQQTVLIVAQHGRFLAQLVHLAGHRVLVADCFGDQDTVAMAERWLPISDIYDTAAIYQTIVTLSQNQPCLLMYGSGVEAFFPILKSLPDTIQLLGNSVETIEQIKTPHFFFSLLQQLNIPYPKTEFTAPTGNIGKWLAKPNTGFGGQFIIHYDSQTDLNDHYYQQYIEGIACSALFLADGQNVRLCLVNRQFQYPSSDRPFLLSGLSTPFVLSARLQEQIATFITLLVRQTKLCGFNSLDFIITPDDAIFVLEINPRISASAALLDITTPIFEQHLSACFNQTLLPLPLPLAQYQKHLHIIFAPRDMTSPEFIDWPSFCRDLPHPNTEIKKDQPICTAIIETSMSFEQSEAIAQQALFSLLGLLENNT
jgi:methenyltetrahydromethanopterin cyclohydrolase